MRVARMSVYPLHLDLEGKRVLVVGAGSVAERRISSLLEAGADVVVVAPRAHPLISRLADQGRLQWRPREFAHSDVIGAWLVHAATDSDRVNRLVADEASRRRIWSVRADCGERSDARTPAVATAAGVVVSVSSGDPRRSMVIRDSIGSRLKDGSLPMRSLRPRTVGSVVLIGGGPGDADLITVRGRRELMAADVVVHDRLGPTSLLAQLDPAVEVVDAGKSPGSQALTQEQINALLVDRARAGLRVARLKGGDPFVLGRGSEEVLACTAAGIAVEVIPGVSSAIAGPAAAGIPVTHRGVSTGFIVISGHEVPDLDAVARSGLTTVVLMGVANLPRLVAEFRAAGRHAHTPVAVVHRAFDEGQRTVTGTLATIEHQVRTAQITNPAIVVIGDVVDVPAHVAVQDRAS
jgi:uroporphyrin-III C-methyltransferase/precorrin-2 dehydrogenase/sirohydrochlorin ferrochelatase